MVYAQRGNGDIFMRIRTLIKVILLAAFIAAILPFIFGILLHQQQTACMNSWAERYDAKVNEITYNRGWKNSSAEYQLYYPFFGIPSEFHTFLGAMTQNSPAHSAGLELLARFEWEHGPWFFGKLARGHLDILLPLGSTKTPVLLATIQIATQWDGTLQGEFDISPLQLKTEDETHALMVGNGNGNFKYRNDAIWNTHMHLDRLAYEEYQLPLYRLESLNIENQKTYHPDIDWIGYSSFKLNELKFMTHQIPWVLQRISSETNAQLVEKNINVTWLASMDALMLDQGRYGPIQLKISAEHIDPVAWKTASQLINGVKQHHEAGVVTLQEIGGFSDLMKQFIAKQPQVILHYLNIQTPQGELQLQGTLNTKKLPKNTAEGLLDWLPMLQVQLDTTVSKQLLESFLMDYCSGQLKQARPQWNTEQLQAGAQQRMSNLLQDWLEKQWVVNKNNQYQLNIHFEDNTLRLNDQIVSSSDFRIQS